jgi:WD40 repeat protein
VSAGAVEVAHEALLREWPRLRAWLDEGAEGRRLHRQLTRAASDWSAGGRDAGELYRGARLAAALEWRADHEPELNATEQRFLEASRAARERARRRVRAVLAGVAALLVLSTGAALVALEQRGQARAEARTAEAQQLGALAQTEEALDHAMLLARQAVALDDTFATRDSLLAVLRRGPAAVGFFPRVRNAVRAIALHPDGRTLAVGDDGGRVTFVRTADRRPLGPPHRIIGASGVSALTFSPDGTRLAATATVMRWRGVIELFDGRTGRYITQVESKLSPTPFQPHFSPDSRVLATQDEGPERRSAAVRRWDARTGAKRPGRTSGTAVGGASVLLGLIDAGARAVTSGAAEGGTVVRDAGTLRTVRRFPFFGSVAALSPAEGLVALGDPDGGLRLLDVRSGRLRSARHRAGAPVVAIRFDVTGERLLTADRDGRLTLWDPKRATPLATLGAGPLGPAPDLQVSRDGRTAYGVSRDGRVVVWDLTGARHWERPFGADMTPSGGHPLAVAPDGSRLAVVDARGFADVFDGRTLRRIVRIRPATGAVTGAAISPDGNVMAITAYDGVDGTVEFWDVGAQRRLGPPQTGHADPAEAVTWSADGRWLATGDASTAVRLWDARRRMPQDALVRGVVDLGLSPDGKLLAVTLELDNFAGALEIRSVPDLELVRTLALPIGTVGRFSPDGRSLLYGARDGRVWTVDTRTWKPRGRPQRVSPGVRSAALSPDGRLLAATSIGGTGGLWDVRSRRPVGAALSGGTGDSVATAFLGASRLAVLHERGGVAWDVRPGAWERHACTVAGRALTRAEWHALLPRHRYAPACARP